MIYLIDFKTCYKIGRTNNLKKRLKTFETSRENVKCLDIISTNKNILNPTSEDEKMEKELHARCKKFHIIKEMFQKTEEVLEIFKTYKMEVGDTYDYASDLEQIHNNTNKHYGRQVTFQYDLTGNFIKEYPSRTNAEIENNIYPGKIKEVIAGRHLTAGGFIWSNHILSNFELDTIIQKIKNSKYSKLNKNTKLVQLDLEGNIINTWDTMTKASKALSIPISSISLCCKGTYKTAGGFKWVIN